MIEEAFVACLLHHVDLPVRGQASISTIKKKEKKKSLLECYMYDECTLTE